MRFFYHGTENPSPTVFTTKAGEKMTYFKAQDFCFPLGERTYIMGILNVTPDSFSDGGLYFEPEKAVERALDMQNQGADIIDIGAQSTRPGAVQISPGEEIARLAPVLKALKGKLAVPISVDTFYPETAEFALDNQAAVINDVSGTVSPKLAKLIKKHGAGWVIMHNGGGASAAGIEYESGVLQSVRGFFEDALKQTRKLGVENEAVCLDPGIGFGKSHEDNLLLLRHLKEVKIDGTALLTAASRKRVVGLSTGEANPEMRAAGTIAAHTAAIAGGTDIIRVHDVAQALQGAKMADSLFRVPERR